MPRRSRVPQIVQPTGEKLTRLQQGASRARPVERKERGRFTIYDNERTPQIAEVLCREYGMTNKQLGVVFDVCEKTIESWVTAYPDFKAACRAGKDAFDGQKVEQALLKRALGYTYVERSVKKTRYVRRIDKERFEVPAEEIIETVKEVPPDVKAIMFWLTNRQVERWKMVTTVNANIKSNSTHTERKVAIAADFSQMNSEQLKALRDIVATQGKGAIEGGNEEPIPMLELLRQAKDVVDAEYEDEP